MISIEGKLRDQYPKLFTFSSYIYKPTVGFLRLLFHDISR